MILALRGGLSSRTMFELKRFNERSMKTRPRKRQKRKPRAPFQPKKHGVAGQHTLAEIFSQPTIWRETSDRLERQGMLGELARTFSARKPWLFVACGSSYYLSQLVADVWQGMLGVPCLGIPASEFLFATEETLRRSGAEQAVLVSRSGETTEVLRVAEILRADPAILTMGVTCSANSTLEKLCLHTLKLTWADEKSTVM